jgi:hypothetical protein
MFLFAIGYAVARNSCAAKRAARTDHAVQNKRQRE